jgi:hypothetical protein
MATSRTTKSQGRSSSRTKARRGTARSGGTRARATSANGDAIALLKSDHRQVEEWFGQFEKARSDNRKQELAKKICLALTVHTQIEEEIFYPAYLEVTEDSEMHHEAAVEHDGAKYLIAQIESSSPDDEMFEAQVSVLSEMIKHHVNEEEKRGGMFAKAKQSSMDLADLGRRLERRKRELMSGAQTSMGGEERGERGIAPALLGKRKNAGREGARGRS